MNSVIANLLKEILGPLVVALEKEADTALESARTKVEADVDAIATRVGIPVEVVNGAIDTAFLALEGVVNEIAKKL